MRAASWTTALLGLLFGSHLAASPAAVSSRERAVLATLSPASLPPPPTDRSNRFADDDAAARLGQELFFDPTFSGPLVDSDNDGKSNALGKVGDTGRVACAGCHVPASGFVDTRSLGKAISLGAGWGVRRAPSLLDVGQNRLLTWDGRRDAFYNQVFAPLESPVEMNTSRLYVAEQLARSYRAQYEAVFGAMPPFDDPARFPQLSARLTGCQPKNGVPAITCTGTTHGMPGDGAEYDGLSEADRRAVTRAVVNFGKALGAYERKLACGPSRFDEWMHGSPGALTDSEQRGAGLFAGKGGCVSCHSGPFLSDRRFHNVGVAPAKVGFSPADVGDKGAIAGIAEAIADPLNTRGAYSDGDDRRLPATASSDLRGAFETPKLRCVGRRPSFMHTGRFHSLIQVVHFFNQGGDGPGMMGTNELKPLGLSPDEEQDLAAFLGALDGPGPEAALLQRP
jgi:cytochrome c peroxidase